MAGLPVARPEEIGLSSVQVERALDLVEQWVASDKIPAAGVCFGRRGRMLEPRFFGRQRPGQPAALRRDALFLVASITKPVTVTALMMLVERGLVALEERVADHVPEFAQNGKQDVTIRHLMTHTSGLPDQLPNNEALRAAHQPLAAFIEEVCRLPLLFPAGTRVNYQSMGTAMLAEVLRRVTGCPLAEFLRREIFAPLGMGDTSLGWQPEKKDRIAAIRVGAELEKNNWNWNTAYWLGFGAPWGGLLTSPADFARFCQMFLNGGILGEVRVLSPATVRTMTTNQLTAMPQVPEEDRRCRPWGLGWRLQWPGQENTFGDLVGTRAYGHFGSTGTMCWLDPDTASFGILFTTQPQADGNWFITRVATMAASALTG